MPQGHATADLLIFTFSHSTHAFALTTVCGDDWCVTVCAAFGKQKTRECPLLIITLLQRLQVACRGGASAAQLALSLGCGAVGLFVAVDAAEKARDARERI